MVEQTEDEASTDDGERRNSGRRSPLASSTTPRPHPTTNSGTGNGGGRQATASSTSADAGLEEEDDDEEEEDLVGERANSVSSSIVQDEIRNCQHQINVATIALEQLRKVSKTTQ